MKYCGIDYSLNSPAIGIWDGEEYRMYFMSIVKKAVNSKSDYLFGTQYPKFYTFEERIDKISDWAISVIEKEKPDHVAIEDYSYNSSGSSVLQIAENTGLLKHKLHKLGVDLTKYAPRAIKKFATNNGNAGKFSMEKSFIKETGHNVKEELGGLLTENPSSDIIDAYYIAKMLKKEHENKRIAGLQ